MDNEVINFIKTYSEKYNEDIIFVILSKCLLISKLPKITDINIIKSTYPYIFEDEEVDYDSQEIKKVIKIIKDKKIDDFGHYYDMLLAKIHRKDLGVFYTKNNAVLDYMMSLLEMKSIKDYCILEPACGSGIFVVNIIKELKRNKNSLKITDNEIIDFVFKNIVLNDIDEYALKIAEINIIIECMHLIINLFNDNKLTTLPKIKIKNKDFIEWKEYDNYNLVISNPPYITLYGKRSRNMTEERRKLFNTFDFVQNKKGNNKFNVSMFFLEKGLKSLKNEGKLIYIIDISFFETAFIDIRKYILENTFISSITTNLSEFKNVASGQVIIELSKTNKMTKTKWIDFKTKEVHFIDQNIWNNRNNDYKIFIPLDNEKKIINDKIETFPKLDKHFSNKSLRTCCALTGKTDEFIVDKNKKTKNCILPYIEGSKGIKNKFYVPSTNKYIEYDYDLQIKLSNIFKEELLKKGVKNKKRVTLGDLSVYLSPKVFIRQSAKQIIATYTEKPYAANNSIYVLSLKDDSEESKNKLKYVCGILNSDLITYYSRINNIIRYGNGKTPQIKVSDLKKVRINFDKDYYFKIIDIVEQLLQNKDYDNNINLINKYVYSIYGLNDKEIEIINEELKKE